MDTLNPWERVGVSATLTSNAELARRVSLQLGSVEMHLNTTYADGNCVGPVLARPDWFRVIKFVRRPAFRLMCFPFAGGRADFYRTWSPHLPSDVELIGVELPGHGTRLREPLRSDLHGMACDIAECLPTDLSANLAFFGHSMGATLAYEVACRMRELGRAMPCHLFVSARAAPCSTCSARAPVDAMTDEELCQTIQSLRGTPEELVNATGWFDLVLPLLKADFRAVDMWRYRPCAPLQTPITTLRGRHDPTISESALSLWRQHTCQEFDSHAFDGDHFYLSGRERFIASLILRIIKG